MDNCNYTNAATYFFLFWTLWTKVIAKTLIKTIKSFDVDAELHCFLDFLFISYKESEVKSGLSHLDLKMHSDCWLGVSKPFYCHRRKASLLNSMNKLTKPPLMACCYAQCLFSTYKLSSHGLPPYDLSLCTAVLTSEGFWRWRKKIKSTAGKVKEQKNLCILIKHRRQNVNSF